MKRLMDRGRQGKCGECGKPGHYRPTCPQLAHTRKPPVFPFHIREATDAAIDAAWGREKRRAFDLSEVYKPDPAGPTAEELRAAVEKYSKALEDLE